MSIKTPIASNEKFSFYHEAFLDDSIHDVLISVTNPSECNIEKSPNSGISATISLSVKDMDSIAIAWIKERKLQGTLGGPVGKEYGSPNCDYD